MGAWCVCCSYKHGPIEFEFFHVVVVVFLVFGGQARISVMDVSVDVCGSGVPCLPLSILLVFWPSWLAGWTKGFPSIGRCRRLLDWERVGSVSERDQSVMEKEFVLSSSMHAMPLWSTRVNTSIDRSIHIISSRLLLVAPSSSPTIVATVQEDILFSEWKACS